ncbi:MAG: FmdB family zinc ribbon protein [Acidobacteriota bacterium]
MPIYEYECELCRRRFERIQKLSDPLVTSCPNCGGSVHKMFSVPALQFKGSGFYVTDYARPAGGGASSEGAGSAPAAKPTGTTGGSHA